MQESTVSKFSRIVKNLWIDLKFGGFLGGTLKTKFAAIGAKDVANSDYDVCSLLFPGNVKPDDVLIDVGCGKGRVINWWLYHKYKNKLIGVELDPDVAEKTRNRFQGFSNVQIIAGNILDHLPQTGTVFYLFNPFTAEIVNKFKEQLELSSQKHPRSICIIYYNPVHLDIFLNDHQWKITPIHTKKERFHKAVKIQLQVNPVE